MKKFLAIVLCLAIIFTFIGCDKTNNNEPKLTYTNEIKTIDDLDIVVTDIMMRPYMNGSYNFDQFTLTNGGNYVFIKITVKNNGTENITFGGTSCDYQLLFDIGRPALEPNAFSQNEHLLRRIPNWQPIREFGDKSEHYYDNIIFEHSNSDTDIVEPNSERHFITGFVTSAKTLEEYNNEMVIHKKKGRFSKEEIGRIVLDERDPLSNANSPEIRLLKDTFSANNQQASTMLEVFNSCALINLTSIDKKVDNVFIMYFDKLRAVATVDDFIVKKIWLNTTCETTILPESIILYDSIEIISKKLEDMEKTKLISSQQIDFYKHLILIEQYSSQTNTPYGDVDISIRLTNLTEENYYEIRFFVTAFNKNNEAIIDTNKTLHCEEPPYSKETSSLKWNDVWLNKEITHFSIDKIVINFANGKIATVENEFIKLVTK